MFDKSTVNRVSERLVVMQVQIHNFPNLASHPPIQQQMI